MKMPKMWKGCHFYRKKQVGVDENGNPVLNEIRNLQKNCKKNNGNL